MGLSKSTIRKRWPCKRKPSCFTSFRLHNTGMGTIVRVRLYVLRRAGMAQHPNKAKVESFVVCLPSLSTVLMGEYRFPTSRFFR
jgi:hypothetical protein